jgi:hypothetical protein
MFEQRPKEVKEQPRRISGNSVSGKGNRKGKLLEVWLVCS